MRSTADMSPPIGPGRAVTSTRNLKDVFTFWRKEPRATSRDHAISSWGMVRHEPTIETSIASQPFATDVHLLTASGVEDTLVSQLGTTTLVLYVGTAMALTPKLGHYLARRSSTLGPGVNLLCVTTQPVPTVPDAFVDVNAAFASIYGELHPPALISLDRDGQIFDIQTDADALLDWLWNDPRPHSRRA